MGSEELSEMSESDTSPPKKKVKFSSENDKNSSCSKVAKRTPPSRGRRDATPEASTSQQPGSSEAMGGDEDGDESAEDSDAGEVEEDWRPTRRRATEGRSEGENKTEIPYTFPCPESCDDLLDIVQDLEDKDVPVVLQRIRTLYHPSLAAENQYKLQV